MELVIYNSWMWPFAQITVCCEVVLCCPSLSLLSSATVTPLNDCRAVQKPYWWHILQLCFFLSPCIHIYAIVVFKHILEFWSYWIIFFKLILDPVRRMTLRAWCWHPAGCVSTEDGAGGCVELSLCREKAEGRVRRWWGRLITPLSQKGSQNPSRLVLLPSYGKKSLASLMFKVWIWWDLWVKLQFLLTNLVTLCCNFSSIERE